MMRRVGFAAGIGMMALVAACSSSPSDGGTTSVTSQVGPASDPATGGASAAIDPCSLLTIAQASELIGEPAEPGHCNGNLCIWGSTKGEGPFVRIGAISKTLYDGAADTVPSGATKTSVDGIGDEAFAKDTGQAGHILWFRTGDKYFQVNVFALRGPLKDLDAEKQVAQYILQKL
jgi:hypothetical protein